MRPAAKIGILIAVIALPLAACASMQDMSRDECVHLGLQPGTPAFANCYEQAMMRRQQAMNAAGRSQAVAPFSPPAPQFP